MSTEKSIVDAGYTVTPAENGGVIVEGRGINAGVCHAFSNAREYLEFLCRQYKGVDPLDCCGPHREKIEVKKAEQGLTDGATFGHGHTFSCTCGSAHNHGCVVHKTGIYGNQFTAASRGFSGLGNTK